MDLTINGERFQYSSHTELRNLLESHGIILGSNIYIGKNFSANGTFSIGDNTVIENDVTIDSSDIGSSVAIKIGSVIMKNSVIPDGSYIKGSIDGEIGMTGESV